MFNACGTPAAEQPIGTMIARVPSTGQRLRTLLREKTPTIAPGVFTPLLGQIAERQGYRALYAGGSALSTNLFGRPDLGLTSLAERIDAVARMVDAVGLPILVDGDTGFGSALTIRQCVKQFELRGAAGIHLEDEASKTTHDFGSMPASIEMMRQRLEVALSARTDADFMIFARCNTLRSHGYGATVERAHAYLSAGADGLFVLGMTVEEVPKFAEEFAGVPLIYNMSVRGDGPKFNVDQLGSLGYRLIIVPNLLNLALARTAQELLRQLTTSGSISGLLDSTLPPAELEEFVRFNEADDFQRNYPLA
jgi:2-methylisocitrate lyase-like PEP mutase family enzyme